jgi:HJR/Mrr/RecB family endonuclease
MLLTRKERFLFDIIIDTIKTIFIIAWYSLVYSYEAFKFLCKCIKYIYNYIHYKKHGFSYTQIENKINHMSGFEFESFCASIFRELGYFVRETPNCNDFGKDLVLTSEDGTKTYVECKRWSGDWSVGRPEIQKLIGAATVDKADDMIFITTGKYNNNALEYASKVDNLYVWTMKDIMKVVKQIPKEKIPGILARF